MLNCFLLILIVNNCFVILDLKVSSRSNVNECGHIETLL